MTLAIIFDSVGAGEWLVLLAVILVVVGPRRMPQAARQLGAFYSKFRRAADNFRRQIMTMDAELEREISSAVQDPTTSYIPDDQHPPADEPPTPADEPPTPADGQPVTSPPEQAPVESAEPAHEERDSSYAD